MSEKKKPLVINLIGGPGCGKSTAAAGLFYALKKLQVNVELSTEWVKAKVYEESFRCMEDQDYIFAKQKHKLVMMQDKVDVIVTDCCLLNSLVYGERDEDLDKYILKSFNKFNNVNFLIRRKQKYQTEGRVESAEEASKLDKVYKKVMDKNDIQYVELDNVDAADYIVRYLLENKLL